LMTKDYLGEGSEELGRNLMKTFWVCLLEADVKPSKIYFINSSVKMVVNDSVHLENIKKLAKLGVEIAACGICLDYFGVKDELGVGSITNMYAITDSIVGDNIIKL
ncbi:MAG: sulfurtransferase-like selenium metabolism protein YedF, partial [Veillonella sp.]